MSIEEALEKHQDHLMSIPGVVGVGSGERAGRPLLIVMADRQLESPPPASLEGFPVEVEVVGEISAF